ncbi:MAG: potassium transporter TrkG [Bacteroidales bacterium]|jgi:Trk-type K+ transport system membrane component
MPSPEEIQQIRERINLRLFSSKNGMMSLLTWGTFIFSIFALLAIVYYYGYPQTPDTLKSVHLIIRASIWFYILKYLIRVFYDFHPGHFIRENRMDSVVFIFMVIEEIFYIVFGHQALNGLFMKLMNIPIGDVSILAVQLYFFIIVGLELGKAAAKLSKLKISPARLLSLSFIGLIGFGTAMLMLPEMTTHGISFIDSLFTSTSAVCVTGLTVIDTATAFTHKGHWIIMILIQLGGINILAFAAFFTIFYRDSSSIKYQSLIKDLLDTDEMSKSRTILRSIIVFSILIEAVGIAVIYFSWGKTVVFHEGQGKLFFSMFHCISAFNNAGFSLWTNNFFEEGVRLSWGVHGVIAFLVFLGGIGFPVLQDFVSLRKKSINPLFYYRYLQPSSRIALRTSFFLIVFGALAFYLFYPVHPDDVSNGGRVMQSVFQSVISRTAGFNSVDIGKFSEPLILIFSFLMFIGASPGSTGGGIKTTTFAVILKSTLMAIRGSKHLTFLQHTLRPSVVQRAISVAVIYSCWFLIGTICLSIAEPHINVMHLVFEEVSALSTVGLSMGVTSTLGATAKTILVLSMFIGRIGSLTIILALIKRASSVQYAYSHANILIG